MTRSVVRATLVACLILGAVKPALAQQSSSGLPFFAIQDGNVQPRHTSPIRQFEAFQGTGLDGPRPPGMGVAPVAPFLTRFRQHRDSRPLIILPLAKFDRAPGDMPYRNDNIRLPGGQLEALRRNAQTFKISPGYASPGDTVDGYGQASIRQPQFYARAFGRAALAGDSYRDGNGDTVPFEYLRNSQQLVLGWTPTFETELFGVFLRDEIDDDRTPSANLDNVSTNRLVGRLGLEQRDGFGVFDRVRADVRYRGAERVNNNFDVRDFTVQPGARRVEVDNEREFFDGRFFGDFKTGPLEHRIGGDWVLERRDGSRFTDSNPASPDPELDLLGARLFPNITTLEIGPTWESAYSPSADNHFRVGLGYRYIYANASAVDTPGQGPFALLAPGVPSTARNTYDFYYGDTDIRQVNHLLKARMLYQRQMTDDRVTLFGELARIDRAADSKERYWTGITPPPAASNRLVGNPELNPERHYQAAVGFQFDGPDWLSFARARRTGETILTGAWSASGALRASYVEDFITRDRARLQSGVLQDDRALIFRNVDAAMFTAELDTAWNVTPRLSTRVNLIYTMAENTSDDRPLYGIAPFEANLLVDYSDRLGAIGTWSVGSKLRLVADQERVDDDLNTGSGFDQGETDGFAVLDVYAGVQIYDRIGLRVGLENVFDTTYEEHVARDTLDSIQRQRIAAPGRSVFVRGIITF